MRFDFKIAILKSGRYQFEIAHAANLSEGRLSRFIRGREQLTPDEERRLREVLGLPIDGETCMAYELPPQGAGAA